VIVMNVRHFADSLADARSISLDIMSESSGNDTSRGSAFAQPMKLHEPVAAIKLCPVFVDQLAAQGVTPGGLEP
jgi:hypothetical protein